MKLLVVLAGLAGIYLLACSSAAPAPVEPTPNIDATVEARLNEVQSSPPTSSSIATTVPGPTSTPTGRRPSVIVPTNTIWSPTPTPTPKRQTLRPSHPSWGSRVVSFDNAVYFLSPVSKLKAEQFREWLSERKTIDHTTDKIYQLRKYEGKPEHYEIRHGFYKKSERRYYTSAELDDYLSTLPDDVVRLDRLRTNACKLRHDFFYGANFTYKWVANPNSGFEDVVLMANCDNVWAVRDGISTKLREPQFAQPPSSLNELK